MANCTIIFLKLCAICHLDFSIGLCYNLINEREVMKMEFEINTTFYLDEVDKKEILETISKGYSVEYAVEDFIEGLDDCSYYLALMVEKEIVDYFKKMLDK